MNINGNISSTPTMVKSKQLIIRQVYLNISDFTIKPSFNNANKSAGLVTSLTALSSSILGIKLRAL